MNITDQYELDVLECSGDFELAQKFGDITRSCVDRATAAVVSITGVDPTVARQGVETAMQVGQL